MLARVLGWLMAGTFCLSVATCGQKGPLELPDEQAAVWGYLSERRSAVLTVEDGLVPSRVEPVTIRSAGDDRRRPYEVPRRLASVCAIRGAPDGLRA